MNFSLSKYCLAAMTRVRDFRISQLGRTDFKGVQRVNEGTVWVTYPNRAILTKGNMHGNIYEPRIDASLGMYKEFRRYARYQSGVYIEFETRSPSICLYVTLARGIVPGCVSEEAALGLDIYEVNKDGLAWIKTAAPVSRFSPYLNARMDFREAKNRRFRVYMPLFAEVHSLAIGIENEHQLLNIEDQSQAFPVIFYGSSITQGTSAARSGLGIPSLVGRAMNCETLNFGFSSSAYGEESVGSLLGSLNASAIVVEYDHNVTAEFLEKTHYKFYSAIRKENSSVPIVFLSRPSGGLSISLEEETERVCTIKRTVDKAIAFGDDNVYFINGGEILPRNMRDIFFADDRHPNQAGLNRIADKIVSFLNHEEK